VCFASYNRSVSKLAIVALFALALAPCAPAQFLIDTSGENNAEALDEAQYYDALDNQTFLDAHDIDNTDESWNAVSAVSGPWSASYANGFASGTGEAATSQGTFSNGLASASLSTFLAVNAELATNLSDPGPYYGVMAGDFGAASTLLDFIPSTATSLTLSGSITGTGLGVLLSVSVWDFSTNTQVVIIRSGAGNYTLADTLNLTAGDSYEFQVGVVADPGFQFDPLHDRNQVDAEGATAYVTASFAPAPEPSAWLLLVGAALAWGGRFKPTRPDSA
jgi:hypothetical protein